MIITQLMDYELEFKNTDKKVIVNQIPLDSDTDRSKLRDLFMSTYTTDSLSSIPTCSCGELIGGYNLGVTCKVCNTEVVKKTEDKIDHKNWLEVPEGITAFITPLVLIYLNKILKAKNNDILQWMLNPHFRIRGTMSKKLTQRIDILQKAGYVRGINSFIKDYDLIISLLPRLMYCDVKKDMSNAEDVLEAQRYLRKNSKVAFTRYLPLPTSILLILESTSVGYYTDKGVSDILDSVLSLSVLKNMENIRMSRKESIVVNALYSLVRYYNISLETQIGKKEGGFRNFVWSSKGHFTGRGVISPIHGPHVYHELHMPWTQGLVLFRFHIISKLLRRGYSILAANDLITAHVNTYNLEIDIILKELIAEAPPLPSLPFNTEGPWLNKTGIPCTFQRNPSLKYISSQNLFVTVIKTDVNDKTFQLSNLVLAGPNADFDGDSMNEMVILDNVHASAARALSPIYSVFDLTKIGDLSGTHTLPNVCFTTLSNWVNESIVV